MAAAVVEKGRNALYHGHARTGHSRTSPTRPASAAKARGAQGAFVADVDGDGWPDIFVTNFGPNILYRNQGNGTFANIAARRASSRPAGTPARRSSTPTATATSTSTSPPTSTRRWTTC